MPSSLHTVTAQITDPTTDWLILLDAESGLPIEELRMEGMVGGIVEADVMLDPPVVVSVIACNRDGPCSEPSNTITIPEPSVAIGLQVAVIVIAMLFWRRKQKKAPGG